jgi:PIN domain nuclease of toxin-antitoxin system
VILLDTHVVIWLLTSPEKISKAAARAIAKSGAEGLRPGMSAASIFELAYLKKRGRVQLSVSDAVLLKRLRGWFEFFPITEMIALEAAAIPDPFHGDPMDRIITATAIVENCTLVTANQKIRDAGFCQAVW